MPDLDLSAIEARYQRALDAKPSKGEWTEQGVVALWDSAADVRDLLAEVRGEREAWVKHRDQHLSALAALQTAAEAAEQAEAAIARVREVVARVAETEHPAGSTDCPGCMCEQILAALDGADS